MHDVVPEEPEDEGEPEQVGLAVAVEVTDTDDLRERTRHDPYGVGSRQPGRAPEQDLERRPLRRHDVVGVVTVEIGDELNGLARNDFLPAQTARPAVLVACEPSCRVGEHVHGPVTRDIRQRGATRHRKVLGWRKRMQPASTTAATTTRTSRTFPLSTHDPPALVVSNAAPRSLRCIPSHANSSAQQMCAIDRGRDRVHREGSAPPLSTCLPRSVRGANPRRTLR